MPITKATQNVITPNIVTTDTRQTITGEKVIQTANYVGTSSTTLLNSVGSKTFTTNTGLAFVPSDTVRLIYNTGATTTERGMSGTVTSYNATTGQMVANITTIINGGSGSWNSWNVNNNSTYPAATITQNGFGPSLKIGGSTNLNNLETTITNNGRILIGATSQPPSGNNFVVDNGVYVNTLFCQRFQPFVATGNNGIIFGSGAIQPSISMSGSQYEWRNVPYTYNTPDLPTQIDLLSVLDMPYPSVSKIISDKNNSILFQVSVIVTIQQITISTGAVLSQKGAYAGNVVIGAYSSNGWTGGGFTGYTANSLSTTQPGTGTTSQVNFTTAAGIAPTLGGIPATGFASIIAVRETASANGTLQLEVRSHTAPNTASVEYWSTTSVHIKMLVG